MERHLDQKLRFTFMTNGQDFITSSRDFLTSDCDFIRNNRGFHDEWSRFSC